ncbi:hypothetical protein [Catellatospora sp. NPDC049133]|jgi:hypothetical protein|uniref:hypothetical protein n=1 Tax=Catellatospora sp. NPDC049133 TaxID=3155499 RepID=UPI0033DF2BD8
MSRWRKWQQPDFVDAALAYGLLYYACVRLWTSDGFVREALLLPTILTMLGLGLFRGHLSDREPIEVPADARSATAAGNTARRVWTQVRRYGVLAVPVLYAVGVVLVDRFVPIAGGRGPRNMAVLVLMSAALGALALAARRVVKTTRPRPAPPPVVSTPVQAKIERAPMVVPRPSPVWTWRALPPPHGDGGGLLTWDDGAGHREVQTSAQLHAELLRLHLSTVTLPGFADFAPETGVPVRIGLGDEQTTLVTLPEDGTAPRVVTVSVGRLRTIPVELDGSRPVLPREAVLPMELAMEILRRYCATGELPGGDAVHAG